MSVEHTLVDDDMHFVMRKIFFEDESQPISSSPQHGSTNHPLTNIPLVLYHNPNKFFSKLAKNIKFY